jgi:hypothetical protein
MHMRRRTISAQLSSAVLACTATAFTACGAQSTHQLATDRSSYAGPSPLAGIDEVPAPAQSRADSLAVVARYRFGDDASAGRRGLPLRVELARSSVVEPQLQLEAHATVVCNPDSDIRVTQRSATEEMAP